MREEGLKTMDSECELTREVSNFGNWINVNVINLEKEYGKEIIYALMWGWKLSSVIDMFIQRCHWFPQIVQGEKKSPRRES